MGKETPRAKRKRGRTTRTKAVGARRSSGERLRTGPFTLLTRAGPVRARIRQPSPLRLGLDPSYKKGYEVRLLAHSLDAITAVCKLARRAGLRPGTPYDHQKYFVVPIYGRKAVEWIQTNDR